jgi:Ca-activated chloride channel family protein
MSSGRHGSYGSSRSYRSRRPPRARRSVVLVAVLLVSGSGAAVAWVAMHKHGAAANAPSASCPNGTVPLNIAVAPDLAGVIQPLLASNPVPCAQVIVTSVDASEMAGFLAGDAKASNITVRPDVWIPDTSLWLQVARSTDKGKQALPSTGTSVAMSPTVVASPKPVAAALGQGPQFSWGQLVNLALSQASQGPAAGTGPQIAIADPTHESSGLASLTVLQALLTKAVNQPQQKVGITGFIKSLSNNTSPSLTDLLAKLPQTEAAGPTSAGIAAFPASEQKVWQYNTTKPAVPLVALYPTDGSPALDYPYTLVAGITDIKSKAANDVQDYLAGAAQDAIMAHGFRAPDGRAGPAVTGDPGLNGQPTKNAPLDPNAAAGALGLWDSLNKQMRMLAVVDISGSMQQPVPGTNGQTRLQMTGAACVNAMGLFGKRSSMGLWTFTTAPKSEGGGTQINKLLPIADLGSPDQGGTHGQRMVAAYGTLADKPGSRNGLYDVLLESYKEVQKGWDPNKVNTVVIFTDGKDDNLNSMSSDQLISRLQALVNPKQPARIFVVALGADVDLTLLNKITAVSGGAAVHFSDMGAMTSAILGSTTTQ